MMLRMLDMIQIMNIKKNEYNDDNGFFIGQHDDDGGDQQDC